MRNTISFLNRLETKINSLKYSSFLFLSGWFILNLIQAGTTELIHDEAYYWFFSEDLSLGYFDHPPFIALLIKCGYFFIKNELGVRLFSVVLGTLSIFILEKIIRPDNKFLFFGIVFSISMFHAGSLVAAPDMPLIFFTATFLFLYQKYLEKDNYILASLLGLNLALLLYSKYHGILIPFFLLLSNFKLAQRASLWYIAIVALILFSPHLYWQYQNDFVTFRFHLFDRSTAPYKFFNTPEYVLGQLAILGPFISIPLLLASYKTKINGPFFRSMRFLLWGILGFFFVSTFKGRVEANWTAICILPLVILSYAYINANMKFKEITYKLFIPSILFFAVARIFLVYDFFPESLKVKTEFHGWKQWAQSIKSKAGDLPVVFQNKFQFASKYTYYTGSFSHSLNLYNYSGSHYDLNNYEDSIQGKRVFLITEPYMASDSLETRQGKFFYRIVDNFRSYNKLRIEIDAELSCPANQKVIIPFRIINHFGKPVNLYENPEFNCFWTYHFYKDGKPYKYGVVEGGIEPPIIYNESKQELEILTPEQPGKYKFRIAIQPGWQFPGRNSHYYDFEVL